MTPEGFADAFPISEMRGMAPIPDQSGALQEKRYSFDEVHFPDGQEAPALINTGYEALYVFMRLAGESEVPASHGG